MRNREGEPDNAEENDHESYYKMKASLQSMQHVRRNMRMKIRLLDGHGARSDVDSIGSCRKPASYTYIYYSYIYNPMKDTMQIKEHTASGHSAPAET